MKHDGSGPAPLALIAEAIDDECARWLGERCEVVTCPPEDDRFLGLLDRASALIVRTYTRVDSTLLDHAPALRVVGRAGVGLDNIDLPACEARAVRVVHTPDANTQSVVEFTLATILNAVRPRPLLLPDEPGPRGIDMTRWRILRESAVVERELAEMCVGVLGLGRIGSRVARALGALGARVLFHDLRDVPESETSGAIPVTFDELLARSDVLTIHVDGRPENLGLIGASRIALLRRNVVLVNTSRGFVIDEAALAAFLRENPDARAFLDVHAREPIPAQAPLIGLANAFLTPHIAAGTRSARRAMSWVVREVWDALISQERARKGG